MRASAQRDWQPPTTPEPWTRGRHQRSPTPARGRRSSGGGTRAGTVARGLTGSLAAGLVVLAVTLVGVQIWADAHGKPGPGLGVVIGHFAPAAVAVALQALADRRRDLVGGVSALGVGISVLATLTYWWWL